jgi:protein-S-isoprenylcysteine O-methyltransferase Ste14
MEEMNYFVLGALFTLGISNDRKYPIMQVLSFISLFYYTHSKFGINSRIGLISNIIDIHGVCVTFIIMAIENHIVSKIIPFIRINFIMKLGALIMIFGYFFSISAICFLFTSRSTFVVNGPYKFMRMPYYAGLILFILGSSMYMGAFFTLGYVYYSYKSELKYIIEKEELMIIKEDEKYRKYMNSVKIFGFK